MCGDYDLYQLQQQPLGEIAGQGGGGGGQRQGRGRRGRGKQCSAASPAGVNDRLADNVYMVCDA